jgi:uncharacterized Zn-binding protein involved in type VI secretion
MSGGARVGDTAGGVIAGGSPDVLTNGKGAVRVGDPVAYHGRSPHSSPVMATGSTTVFINGKPACKAGDVATCGHQAGGSTDVEIG